MGKRPKADTNPSSLASPSVSGDPARNALDLLLSMGRELQRKEPVKAADCLRRASELGAQIGALDEERQALLLLGTIEIQRGALDRAEPLLSRALALASASLADAELHAGGEPRAAGEPNADGEPQAGGEPNADGESQADGEPKHDRALATAHLVSCRNALAHLRLRQGQGDKSIELLRESLTDLSNLPAGTGNAERAETLELLGAVYAHRGEAQQGLIYFGEALELRRGLGDETKAAQDLNQLGNLRHRMGQYQEAVACYRLALQAFLSLADSRSSAATANNLASTLMRLGEFDEARRLFQECLPLFQELGETPSYANVLANLGLLAQIRGNMDEAEGHYQESLRLHREQQDPIGESNSLTNLSYLSVMRGRLDEALARAEESIALLHRTGLTSTLAPALVCKGVALLELERLGEARALAEEALQVARQSRALDQSAEVLALRAQVFLKLGSFDPALEDAQESLRIAEDTGDPEMLAFALRVCGAARLERGELEEAKDALAKASRLLRGWDLSFERARILFEEGMLLSRAGAVEAAAERLRRVERIFGRLGNIRWRILSLLKLAQVVQPIDPAQSDACRAEARVLAEEHEMLEWYQAAAARAAAVPGPSAAALRGAALEALSRALLQAVTSGRNEPVACFDPFFEFLGRELRPARVRLQIQNERVFRWIEKENTPPARHFRILGAEKRPAGVQGILEGAGHSSSSRDHSSSSPAAVDGDGAAPVSAEFTIGSREDPVGRLVLEPEPDRPLGPADTHACATAAAMLGMAIAIQFERADRTGLPEGISADGSGFDGLIGSSRAMRGLYRLISQSAPTDSTILILGESGTGKELVARSVHARSRRNDRPFVAINCPSIPKDLIESELFGHEKGAFTGAAVARPGKIELAQGGTLFLDEVGDMPLATQAKLLRFLQEREFERVGGRRPIRVDVRLISATSRDLSAAIEQGDFREDLFYRLNVVPLHVPSLRERREDIPALVQHFLIQLAGSRPAPLRLTASALDRLLAHEWPGNVRELRNTIEHMTAFCEGELLEAGHLPAHLRGAGAGKRGSAQTVAESITEWTHLALRPGETLASRLMQVEAALLRGALDLSDWNQSLAARRLGITENKVRSRMKHYGIRRPTKGGT